MLKIPELDLGFWTELCYIPLNSELMIIESKEGPTVDITTNFSLVKIIIPYHRDIVGRLKQQKENREVNNVQYKFNMPYDDSIRLLYQRSSKNIKLS